MNKSYIIIYIFITICFTGILDGVEKSYCGGNKYGVLPTLTVGILWPITMPVLATASFAEKGLTCGKQQ